MAKRKMINVSENLHELLKEQADAMYMGIAPYISTLVMEKQTKIEKDRRLNK